MQLTALQGFDGSKSCSYLQTVLGFAFMELKKFDDEKQIVYGEVYAPSTLPDSQGDVMSSDAIERMAHRFLAEMRVDQIDVNHDHVPCGAIVVESFVARKGDSDFIPGSWVVAVHVPDVELWIRIKKGDLNGFSMEATVLSRGKQIEVEIPEIVHGRTEPANGHDHPFTVKFDEDGNFLGGVATKGDTDHDHPILKGTATETVNGHSHRFSFVEVMIPVEEIASAA